MPANSGTTRRASTKQGAGTRSEWWESYFDAQYLLEYEPIFTFERDRREVSRLLDAEFAADARVEQSAVAEDRIQRRAQLV